MSLQLYAFVIRRKCLCCKALTLDRGPRCGPLFGIVRHNFGRLEVIQILLYIGQGAFQVRQLLVELHPVPTQSLYFTRMCLQILQTTFLRRLICVVHFSNKQLAILHVLITFVISLLVLYFHGLGSLLLLVRVVACVVWLQVLFLEIGEGRRRRRGISLRVLLLLAESIGV